MNLWFLSDTHLGHANIIRYCNRPFKTLEEMDSTIINNWNQRVKKDDMVLFVGDFCFTKSSEASNSYKNAFVHYRNQLNGNIIFIKGNHDKNNHIKSVIENMTIIYGGQRIFLTHNPMYANPKIYLNLCGHVHDKYKIKRMDDYIIINLSVEQWGYKPIAINEILAAIKHDQ